MSMKSYESLTCAVSRMRTLNMDELNAADKMRSAFEGYRSRGVIINNSFEDNVWILTNETNNVKLSLTFADDVFTADEWIGCRAEEYRNCMKSYIIYQLGELQLSSLQSLVRLFKRIGTASAEDATEVVRDAHHALEFFRLLPGSSEYRDNVIETIEERHGAKMHRSKNSQQRTLAEFNNYLRFNEAIETFWQTATHEEKLFYFPIYFWWNLTAILPLRVTEFLLTPRSCLEDNTLTIRRTKLKGGGIKISYRVADDYECHRYNISERLADEVRWYLRETGQMQGTDLDTLLLLEPYHMRLGKRKMSCNRYYSYDNLSDTLKYFFGEYATGQNKGIESIRLGDTRHLAMISLIISGGSPVICRELAGHTDINISSGYYSNISTFVECMTIERFRSAGGISASFSGKNYYPTNIPTGVHRVSGGNCDALSVKNGDVGECIKAMGNDGHIGDCKSCKHFWPDTPGVQSQFRDAGANKKLVDADSQYLLRMIELARRGLGYQEDIGNAILRLQHSCHRLSVSLSEKYFSEEKI